MPTDGELPDTPLERAQLLQNMLVAHATDGVADSSTYTRLRKEFMADATLRPLLPDFVRTSRDPAQFWAYVKKAAPTYQQRRTIIWNAFAPLFDHLEGRHSAPPDAQISDALAMFDVDGVHAVWGKALERRTADPEGAITVARTLLETVCKRVLDASGVGYKEEEELPALYSKVAKQLNLAPSHHTEESFRIILGSAHQIVERLGSLRNKIGDAHGKGGNPVRPAPRHAHLAVNLAGTIATFLVETWQARQKDAGRSK